MNILSSASYSIRNPDNRSIWNLQISASRKRRKIQNKNIEGEREKKELIWRTLSKSPMELLEIYFYIYYIQYFHNEMLEIAYFIVGFGCCCFTYICRVIDLRMNFHSFDRNVPCRNKKWKQKERNAQHKFVITVYWLVNVTIVIFVSSSAYVPDYFSSPIESIDCATIPGFLSNLFDVRCWAYLFFSRWIAGYIANICRIENVEW